MSEGEKQANNQPRGSWGWAGRRPPDWADFRGSRGRHGTWPASACARGTSTASRRISLILAGDHVPAWHRTRPGRPGPRSPGTPITAGGLRCAKSSTPNLRCHRLPSPTIATQRDRLPCLLHTILAEPAPTDVVIFSGWTPESQARPSQRPHSQLWCLGITFGC